MNVWTRDIPNSEHEDKCIFTNYECDEQFYPIIENLEDTCCLEELITESNEPVDFLKGTGPTIREDICGTFGTSMTKLLSKPTTLSSGCSR